MSLIGVETLPQGLNSPNYAGHRPFAGGTDSPDTTRPNAAFFDDFKSTLRKLREHNLTVFLVVGWAAAWQDALERESYCRYVEFVLDQYPVEEFPNIVWCLGGDKGMFRQKNLDKPMQIEAGRRLRRLMDARGDRRLIGDHPGRGSSVINYTPEEAAGWLDFYTVQSGHRGPTQDVPDWIRQAYERRPVKPVFNGEPLYEAHNPGVENAEVRWAHWVSVFSGACAASYGCQGFWGIGTEVPDRPTRPGHGSDWWKQHLDDQPVARQMRYFEALNRAYPFHRAVPDYALEAPLILSPGLPTVKGDQREPGVSTSPDRASPVATSAAINDRGQAGDYKAALLAMDRTWALVYLPSGPQARRVTVRMDWFRGPVRARWFDPTSGAWTESTESFDSLGRREFRPSARNLAGQWDWVLVLTCAVPQAGSGVDEANQSKVSSKLCGVLRVHPTNPRYFTDDSGKAVYLTRFST